MPRIDPSIPRRSFADLSNLPVSVDLGSFRGDLIYWGLIEPRWWRNYLHSHSFFEICCAFAGEGVFRINGVENRVRRGDVFVARPNELHEIISSRGRALGIYFWSFTLVPRKPRSAESAGVDSLIDALHATHQSIRHDAASVQRTCELLAMEAAQRQAGYLLAVQSLTRKLILDTARAVTSGAVNENPDDFSNFPDRTIATARRYLKDNFARPIGVRDVAAQVHLSERHLARLFRKAEGKTMLDYLTQLRIDAAARMLLNPDRTIKEIAIAVGYPDVHYFTTIFGKRTGQTPAAFRAGGGTTHLTAKRHEQP